MKDKYSLGSKSDMKQYAKDLEQRIKNAAIEEAMGRMYDVEYETHGQGSAKITKAGGFKCPNQDHSSPICSRCPIFYTPTTQTP